MYLWHLRVMSPTVSESRYLTMSQIAGFFRLPRRRDYNSGGDGNTRKVRADHRRGRRFQFARRRDSETVSRSRRRRFVKRSRPLFRQFPDPAPARNYRPPLRRSRGLGRSAPGPSRSADSGRRNLWTKPGSTTSTGPEGSRDISANPRGGGCGLGEEVLFELGDDALAVSL